MEQNLPIVTKKLWHMIRVAYFMVRKGISKAKLTLELNLLLKRGKIASRSAMHNLIFHHHHNNLHHSSKTTTTSPLPNYAHETPAGEYEFSCSNTPAHPFFSIPGFHLKKRKKAPRAEEEVSEVGDGSPALPGFGKTPVVRQLRVSDSPFGLMEGVDEEAIEHVDEAAEEFIVRFYRELKKQNGLVA